MNNLLIIYPHWPPSNLAGVHRPRLIANQLRSYGWQSIILTVSHKYYEEIPDPDLFQTVADDVEVYYARAFRVPKPRIIGDLGIRAYPYLMRKALSIIRSKSIKFIWIPIPSYYAALLGRKLHHKTGIPYGIDYIDPWVRDISTRNDWRHRISNWLARILEPIAVKKASLITGVSYEYYKPVMERNFKRRAIVSVSEASVQQLSSSTVQRFNGSTDPPIYHEAFPYGFDPRDHSIKLNNIDYPWAAVEEEVKPWIYAGAFLPNSRVFVNLLFEVIGEMRKSGNWEEKIRLYFIGTGAYSGKSIEEHAVEAGIKDLVTEDRERYPYLHVLNYLCAADTVMVIGSTEKHYTASKVYQALLSESPVWAIFHKESSAVVVMEECKADQFLVKYKEAMTEDEIKATLKSSLLERLKADQWKPDLKALDKYSAKESARKLVEGIKAVLGHAELDSASVESEIDPKINSG